MLRRYIIKIVWFLACGCICLGLIYGIRHVTQSGPDRMVESAAESAVSESREPEPGEAEGTEPGEAEGTEPGEAEGTEPGELEGTGEAKEPGEMAETVESEAEVSSSEPDRDIRGDGSREEVHDEELEEEGLPKVIIASDLHLLAAELMDGGEVFAARMAKDDGKVTAYSGEVIEAFLAEVMEQKPDVLVLGGDLSFEGDRRSHQELAGMLFKVQEAGIQVLAMPGNHDINNPKAAAYLGDEEETLLESVTPEEFEEIYHTYGYDQAISRDEDSLSYIYPLRDDIWLMLLDTNLYDPVNLVEGEIQPETYQWMIQELDRAREAGIQVLPVGHHNLLQESRMYTSECMIRSHASAVWLFEEYQLPLYLSGHLHVQKRKKYKAEPGVPQEAYGIYEIVTSSLGMSPHQYGVVTWEESGRMYYQVERVDVEAWAVAVNSEDENLLSFDRYSRDWFYGIVGRQIYKKMGSFPEEDKWDMAYLYADVLYRYGAGEWIDKREVEQSEAYELWKRLMGDNPLFREMNVMLED